MVGKLQTLFWGYRQQAHFRGPPQKRQPDGHRPHALVVYLREERGPRYFLSGHPSGLL